MKDYLIKQRIKVWQHQDLPGYSDVEFEPVGFYLESIDYTYKSPWSIEKDVIDSETTLSSETAFKIQWYYQSLYTECSNYDCECGQENCKHYSRKCYMKPFEKIKIDFLKRVIMNRLNLAFFHNNKISQGIIDFIKELSFSKKLENVLIDNLDIRLTNPPTGKWEDAMDIHNCCK